MTLRISVVVPVYNDPSGLRVTLDSLVMQDFPRREFEIIVVDNGSTDETHQVAAEFARSYSDLVRVGVENEIRSSYAARNKGIQISSGEILCFVDADMSAPPGWLKQVSEAFENPGVEYLACNVELYADQETLASRYNRLTGFRVPNYVQQQRFAPTCCLVIRRSLVERIGWFDARLFSSGDLEFGNRASEAGVRLEYRAEIILRHPARSSVRQLMRKVARLGKGQAQLVWYHPQRYASLNSKLISPRRILPSRPWRFASAMRGRTVWEESGAWDKTRMYILSWLLGLRKHIAYRQEMLRLTSPKNSKGRR